MREVCSQRKMNNFWAKKLRLKFSNSTFLELIISLVLKILRKFKSLIDYFSLVETNPFFDLNPQEFIFQHFVLFWIIIEVFSRGCIPSQFFVLILAGALAINLQASMNYFLDIIFSRNCDFAKKTGFSQYFFQISFY